MTKQRQQYPRRAPREEKPFPVVEVRLRPVSGVTDPCVSTVCQSQKLFSQRQHAAFLFQPCGDMSIMTRADFSPRERRELVWERAYRDQKAGREPASTSYLMCAQCAAWIIAQHLGAATEREASLALVASVTTGQDLILYDRNLSRDSTYPSVAIGTFETLADFRRQYWEELD